MVGRRAAVRSIVPGEAGGGRALTWSVPLVTRTDGNLTSSAQLEAWSAGFQASNEALERRYALSGSSDTLAQAWISRFEVSERDPEASSEPDRASSGMVEACSEALEAWSGAIEA